MIFENKPLRSNLKREVHAAANEFLFCASQTTMLRRKQSLQIRWSKPELGWVKLNTDGSFIGNPGLAGCGGLMRDHNERWIKGFTRSLGQASSVEAKLWALRDGLMLCVI